MLRYVILIIRMIKTHEETQQHMIFIIVLRDIYKFYSHNIDERDIFTKFYYSVTIHWFIKNCFSFGYIVYVNLPYFFDKKATCWFNKVNYE